MAAAIAPSHRMAHTNYPIRVGSFAYSLLVLVVLLQERGVSLTAASLLFPVLVFLVYPHLAWWQANRARDAHAAELNNLVADAVLLGVVAAEMKLAVWPSFSFALALAVNNAVCGGTKRLAIAIGLFVASGLAWHALRGHGVQPDTSGVVTALCAIGVTVYVGAVGLVMHWQTEWLLRTRNALRSSEEQFRFIAEHAGDLVAVLDAKGRIRYASGSYQERFDPNLIGPGCDWTGLVAEPQRGGAKDLFASVLRSRRSARAVLTFAGRESLELETAVNVMEDPNREGESLLVVISQRSSPQWRHEPQSVDGASERAAEYGLLLTSVLGRIEYASVRMAQMLGFSPGALIGKTLEEIAAAVPDSRSLIDDVWAAIDAAGRCDCRFVLMPASGQLTLARASIVPLSGARDEAVRYAWTIAADQVLTEPQTAPL